MNLALVLTPWYRRESPAPEFAMITAVLRSRGFTVGVYDINNRIFSDGFAVRKFWKYFLLDAPAEAEDEFLGVAGDLYEHYAGEILSQGYDAVIFKIIGKTYANALAMARVIKGKKGDIPVVFTGALTASREDVEAFVRGQDALPCDHIICGEDEIALPELLRSIESHTAGSLKRRGKIIDTTEGPVVEDLDTLPHYDFTDFDLAAFRCPEKLEIFISKGCPRACSFCLDWLTEKKFRAMSGKRLFDEVQYQARLHKTQHFRFCDKTINGDPRAIEEFSDRAIVGEASGLPLPQWSGDAILRPEMTFDLLKKMRRAGCVGLGYGLESGSDPVIKAMNKGFTAALAEEVIRNTHAANIYTSINIMVGFPSESYADFEETVRFVERNSAFINEVRLTFIGCRILKQSTLGRFPERFNIADIDADHWSTKDGANTYDERVRRFELISQRILGLGIELRVNSRITKKVIKEG